MRYFDNFRSQRIGVVMTKEQALQIIKLLSAVESWSFADNHRMPDYLYEQIEKAMEVLEQEVLK
jgi:hypothetical protein